MSFLIHALDICLREYHRVINNIVVYPLKMTILQLDTHSKVASSLISSTIIISFSELVWVQIRKSLGEYVICMGVSISFTIGRTMSTIIYDRCFSNHREIIFHVYHFNI